MNLALLSKLGWFFATDSGRMWTQALRSKYYAGSSFMSCNREKNISWTWNSILLSRKLIENGLCYRVGKRDRTSIWEDPWVPYDPSFKPSPSTEGVIDCGIVESLWLPNGEWNVRKLQLIFDSNTATNISRIPTTNRNLDDKLVWVGTRTGLFSVKSAFELGSWKDDVDSPWWKRLWASKVHEQIKFFLWKLANHELATASNLLSRNIRVDMAMCVHGCNCLESENHLFFHCQVARAVWFAMPWSIRWELFIDLYLEAKLDLLSDPNSMLPFLPSDVKNFFIFGTLILDQLWKIRNSSLFDNKCFSLETTMDLLHHRYNEAKTSLASFDSPVSGFLHPKFVRHNVPSHFIRINTDAAIKNGGSMIGVVARSFKGEVLKI